MPRKPRYVRPFGRDGVDLMEVALFLVVLTCALCGVIAFLMGAEQERVDGVALVGGMAFMIWIGKRFST